MNDRFKEIRKALKLSQDVYGKRLGVSGAAVSRIESGGNALTDQMILLVCKEFSISEEWLRSGSGEMFKYDDRNISNLAEEFNLDEYGVRIIMAYQKMPLEDREALIRFMRNVVDIQDDSEDEGQRILEKIHEDRDESSSFIG